jgi:drug/metabolite transporter (DMT)-like permease
MTSLDVADADLERMTDAQLVELEDRLLLDQELDSSKNARFSVGRAVVFVLTLFVWGIVLTFYAKLPTERLGPLNIPLYIGTLFVAVVVSTTLWSKMGRGPRTAIRWIAGHWPLALYVAAILYRFTR